jgi:hypothetical protein
MRIPKTVLFRLSLVPLLITLTGAGPVSTKSTDEPSWARVTESDNSIKIETDKLEAVIPKRSPKQWMTGIEKGSFLDKATGFREAGDGLLVVDWLMEPGSDEAWQKMGMKTDRYLFNNDYHGKSPKRILEGPQLCHKMKPVKPEVIRGKEFVAVKTTYRYEHAAPGHKAGSQWTQLLVFPKGQRYFFSMDRIDTVNNSEAMFLRTDMPGCVRHKRGETFSEIYLSYLDGPKGKRIPPSEFYNVFSPDDKFTYRRGKDKLPEHFIRGYRVRDPKTGKQGPWLAGMALESSIVYEAWCNQRPGIIIFILEIGGRKIRAGESFSGAYIVGYFDTIEEMHAVNARYKGHTALHADKTGWKLLK